MSGFNILAVRDGEATDDPLYPMPGEQANSVEPDEHDGQPLPLLVASELVIREIPPGGSPKRLLRLHDVKAAVSITEGRVAVACSKYDKGGGWTPFSVGAVPVTATLNAVSKAKASKRRGGKMLVGHVRYPLLLSVGYKPRGTAIGRDQLRLGTVDPTQSNFRGLVLDITLPRQQSGGDLAKQIASLAASYRLDNPDGELDEASRERLQQLEAPPALKPVPKQFASYFFVDTSNPGLATAFQKA